MLSGQCDVTGFNVIDTDVRVPCLVIGCVLCIERGKGFVPGILYVLLLYLYLYLRGLILKCGIGVDIRCVIIIHDELVVRNSLRS